MEQTTQRFNPETGKPNPVSMKEFYLMDRKEQRAFLKPLSSKEQMAFVYAYDTQLFKCPKSEMQQLREAKIQKLSERKNSSISDRIELAMVKLNKKLSDFPEKPAILFRKWNPGLAIQQKFHIHSPYLIG